LVSSRHHPQVGLLALVLLILLAGCSFAAQASPTPTPLPPTPLPVPLPVRVETNLLYQSSVDPEADEQKVDIYAPDVPGKWPVVVYAHGSTESKENDMSKKVGRTLAENGYLAFVIDYDPQLPEIAWLKDGRGFRELAETTACAMRFARARAPTYGGDPQNLIWMGFSAGGYAGGAAAMHVPDQDELWQAFAEKRGGPGQQVACVETQASDQVNALVILSSYYYIPSELEEKDAELFDLLNKIYPSGERIEMPIRMLHGTKDNVVLYKYAEEFSASLEQLGYDIKLTSVPGGHGVYLDELLEILSEFRR
jgi:acetyl esterase/lipase